MNLILSGEPAAAAPASGSRYLRLRVSKLTQAGTWVYLTEVRFMAGGVAYPTVSMTANSSPAPLVASATSDYGAGYEPYRAFEWAVPSSAWSSYEQADGNGDLAVPQSLVLDLGAGAGITPAAVRITTAASYYPADFTVGVSNDGTNWTTLGTFTGISSGWSSLTMREFTFQEH